MNKLTRKRSLSLLMAVLLCLIAILGIGTPTAYAAAEQAEVCLIAFPREGDENLDYTGTWGHGDLQFMNGWQSGTSVYTTIRAMESSSGNICYCIEPGVAQKNGDVLTRWGEDFWENYPSDYNHTIEPYEIKQFIGRIMQYGYTGTISMSWKSQNDGGDKLAHAVATQLLIWEAVVGERDSDFNHVDTGSYDPIFDRVRSTHPLYDQIVSYYNSIEASIKNHSKLPSFMSKTTGKAQNVELEWDGSQYTATLTDNNGVLANYTFSASESGISFSVSGNKLTITAAEAPSGTVSVTAEKLNSYRRGIITWTDGTTQPGGSNIQDVVTYAESVSDPVKGFLNLQVSYGSVKIVKTSEDGVVAGVTFTITGNGVNETVKTGSGGEVLLDNLTPGTYTVTEQKNDIYVPQESKTVTVVSGQTAAVEFSNSLKKFTVSVVKSDRESGQTQGDASLQGAVYGIYKDGELIDTYETGPDAAFTTKEYTCGSGWTIREITPSEGYLLDERVHQVGAEPGNFAIEHNSIAMNVAEDVIKGSISIIKHTDDGSTQIETPEEGAEFEIYLKSAGSYEAADPDERDILVCDANGFAQSKDLPYGEYVVEQTKGWDGRELMAAFTVEVSEHGKAYKYLINNDAFKAYLKIVKTDAETGKPIPYAGAVFEIYAPDGSLIEMTTTYPSVEKHTEFETSEDGWLITPEVLPYGIGYTLVEKKAPEGYVLNTDPVWFDVTPENAVSEDGITIIVTEKRDMPQMGKLLITKTGEVFASVTEQDGRYTPVYAEAGLAGAEFEVRAAEDVYTPDGTLRYTQGEVVVTLTTLSDGTAESVELYLGKFEIVETTAPYGMVKNEEAIPVELVYAGQEVSVTSTSVSLYNERQKVEVKLYKDLEKDELFQIGSGEEILHVYFALYAAEDLTAADGTVLPDNGLIEIAGVQADGTLTFSSDIPIGSYYVKEYSTNESYLISDEVYPITFTYDDDSVAVVRIEVNDGEAILNRIIRGSIQGIKVDEAGEPLPGTTFGLFRADCTEFTADNALLITECCEDGSFRFENIPYGVWLVRELSCVEGYVLSEEIFEVQISEDEQLIELGSIENRPIRGSVQVTKVDLDYPENRLTGAVFDIYLDVDGDGVYAPDTDAFYGTMDEIETGVYFLDDLLYNGYFLHEETAPEGYLKDDQYYFFEIRNDGETVTVENEAGIGFVNQPETPDVPDTPDAPQTGDDSNILLWSCIAGASLGAIVFLGIKCRKRRKKTN